MNLMQLLEWLNEDWAQKERERRMRQMLPAKPTDRMFQQQLPLQEQLQLLRPEFFDFLQNPQKPKQPKLPPQDLWV